MRWNGKDNPSFDAPIFAWLLYSGAIEMNRNGTVIVKAQDGNQIAYPGDYAVYNFRQDKIGVWSAKRGGRAWQTS